jgi:hypothetical protein
MPAPRADRRADRRDRSSWATLDLRHDHRGQLVGQRRRRRRTT